MRQEIQDIRKLLDARFPGTTPSHWNSSGVIPFGISEIDKSLREGGIPRGQVASLSGTGCMALGRAAIVSALNDGTYAAWIDASGELTAEHWVAGSVVIRCPSGEEGLAAAETLARSSGFAIVVLSGSTPSRSQVGRLTRAAREGHCALVFAGAGTDGAQLRIRCQIDPSGGASELEHGVIPISVDISGSTVPARTIIHLPLSDHALRLSLVPDLADRRGA